MKPSGTEFPKHSPRGSECTRENTWDSQNRLVQCVSGGHTSAFAYGPDGLRRSSTVDSVRTDYLLDGQSVIQEFRDLDEDDLIETTEAVATYCPGPRGIEFRIDESSNRRWYLYDGLGSVLAEVNDNGTMTAVRKYDVYGALRTGSDQGSGSQKFCGSLGHSTEPSTGGLIYMRARWYDPSVGRFISEDPARDGANWYTYCNGNPVTRIDPTGRETLADTLITAGLVGCLNGMISGVVNMLTRVDEGTATGNFLTGFLSGFIGGALSTLGLPGAVGGAFTSQFLQNLMNGQPLFLSMKRALVSGGIALGGGALGLALASHQADVAIMLNLIQFDADAIVDAGSAMQKL